MSNKLNLKLVLLPFIYFYVLSFMLILVSAYWLIVSPGKIGQTYAQTENLPEPDIEINVSELKEGEVLSSSTEYCAFGNEKAQKIDKFFEKNKAPLAGQGCNFVREGQVNEIEPNLVAAIAMCESGGGKITPKFNGITSYNAWGWAVYDSVDTMRSVQGHNCDTWEHCIGRVSRGIVANSKERNLGLEPADIVQWYTPASVAKGGGDPENAPWVLCVKGTMNKIAATHIPTN
jgi:hypothetical protein